MRSRIIGTAFAVAIAAAGPALAADLPSGGMTLSEVAAWVSGQGYPAQTITGNDGKQHLQFDHGGVNVGVYMFDCSDGRCGSIQFAAGWATHGKFDTTQMNAWDRDKRWCRGYFDNENDPWVEYDVDLTPGGTYELLADEFHVYEACLKDFKSRYSL